MCSQRTDQNAALTAGHPAGGWPRQASHLFLPDGRVRIHTCFYRMAASGLAPNHFLSETWMSISHSVAKSMPFA